MSPKLVSVEQLLQAIGPRPRTKQVILCHGVFDIVHPGHLRHLMYARQKADVLVASITADEFVTKGNVSQSRPYVPEELRAQNLAAFEIVDYVLVDRHPTPIPLLDALQPDFLAKGYEYFRDGVPPRTQEELDALARYGGEMVFTPGDVVYSSSTLLDLHEPRLTTEKLMALLDSERLSLADLKRAVSGFNKIRVHVIGDTIVDRYTSCSILGASPKSPSFSVRHDGQETFIGGAAVVAKHLAAAGANVVFSTVLGEDEEAEIVRQGVAAAGITLAAVGDHTRPTTVKERFVADGYRLLQVDRVDNRPISDGILDALKTNIAESDSDILVFSDFRHGIFNGETIPSLVASTPQTALRIADSQVSNRWGNILDFSHFDLITPNEREARFALGDQDSVVRALASHLYAAASCRFLLLKLGERGLIGYRPAGPEPREFFSLDSFATQAVDPVGAGDALLAYAALTLAVTESIVLSAVMGSFAAAIACEREGNAAVGSTEMLQKLA